MDASHSNAPQTPDNQSCRWDRWQTAQLLRQFDRRPDDLSQRQFATQHDVPRSTLQDWRRRRGRLQLEPELADFLESPAGVRFLHRLMISLHLVFVLHGGCGLRKVGEFLNSTGLDQVVAPSYASQHQFGAALIQQIVAYAQEQQQRLAANMPPRKITVAEDETFHPKICLVAMEVVSGFLLAERYADHRDAETWDEALHEAVQGMSVEIIQLVGDEAKGLLAHARNLHAHHSPDLFHVQQELSKATSASLASHTQRAEKVHDQAQQQMQRLEALQQACQAQCGQSAAAHELAVSAVAAARHADQAQEKLQASRQRQEQARLARRGVSEAYHPFDLSTGQARDAEQVERQLNARMNELKDISHEAGLSAACQERIAKAQRVVSQMAATIAFFWRLVRGQLAELSLSVELERNLIEHVLPAQYLHLAAAKAPTAERRQALRNIADRLSGLARDGPFGQLSEQEQSHWESQARLWAQWFQRSSSCVEGRNGHLSLWHHSWHRLSDERLSALRALGNYYVLRDDETTAAERFFGASPDDMLEWLLDHMPCPSRPALRCDAA
jgi:hypothetical protein